MGKLKNFIYSNKEDEANNDATVYISASELDNKPIRNKEKSSNTNIYTPHVFSEVENIANEILNKKSVIVDLTNTDLEIAKRICDFLNGVTFAINGNVKKVAKLVYMFSI